MAPTLPIIPIAPFLTSSSTSSSKLETAKALHVACRDFGFFYLNLDGYATKAETDELNALAKQFFDLPQETKDKIALRKGDGARGYARLNENVTNGKADAHEGIDFYRPVGNPVPSRPLWGENQWPDVVGLTGFKEKYDHWVEKMIVLGNLVMDAMAIGLGLTEEERAQLKHDVEQTFWVMRVIGYPPLPNDHDGFSCGAHKDYGCLTFLYADPTPSALQVYLHNPTLVKGPTPTNGDINEGDGSGVWINADPIEGCVVCNIGEMWEIWTNGLYKSTLHRVMHRGTNYRISIPFFFEPSMDAAIKPLPSISFSNLTDAKDIAILQADGEERERLGKGERRELVYGLFLLEKVQGNFANDGEGKGGGRY